MHNINNENVICIYNDTKDNLNQLFIKIYTNYLQKEIQNLEFIKIWLLT